MTGFFAKKALLPDGWADDVLISVDETGWIRDVQTGQPQQSGAQDIVAAVIPAMPNLHSHAFQYALAGKTEFRGSGEEEDSFWTWRKAMYEFQMALTPETMEQVAFALYSEMVKAGYGWVVEFHYVHHRPDGTPYDDPAAMSNALIRAAQNAGIGMTLLPVLYAYSGFGEEPPEDGQKRFIHDTERYIQLLRMLYAATKSMKDVRIGVAFHSLRAVSKDMMDAVLAEREQLDNTMPVHIHIAEQEKEVYDCIAWCAQRPVEWLYDNFNVDANWCLIHATHMVEEEIKRVAKSGAVAGLCPVTEANLGDGLFNLPAYISEGGRLGIGSDSHISVDAAEELRWLEYGQRLKHQKRNIACTEKMPHVGTFLYLESLRGGAQASGTKIGRIAPGCRADFLVFDAKQYLNDMDFFLDTYLFTRKLRPLSIFTGGKRRF